MTKAVQHKQTVLLSIDDGVDGHIAEGLNLGLASLLCPEHVLVNLRGGSFLFGSAFVYLIALVLNLDLTLIPNLMMICFGV